MSKEFKLFERESVTFSEKFYILMDLLISNQANSRMECVLFMGVYYLQIISGFFSEQLGVFDKDNNTSDKILTWVEKILRFKDLFVNKYKYFKVAIIFLFVMIILFSILFFYSLYKADRNSTYTAKELLLNFFFKFMIYIGFNICLDMGLSNFCFGSDDHNPYFNEISCKPKDNIIIVIIGIILVIIACFFVVFIQFFYIDSFYSSNSFYARMTCNYEIYTSLNCIAYSVLLTQVKYISNEIFLIYNIIASSVFFKFFLNHYLFYDTITNIIAGLFHILYVWSSVYFAIFTYIDFHEKGLIYLISAMIVLYLYFNLKYKIEESIFLDNPFYKIKNQNYRLYYVKNLIDKIHHLEENPEDKALLAGIVQTHIIECPNPDCISKTKEKLYLPITGEISDRTKLEVDDKIYLTHFIIIVLNYYIEQNDCTPDVIINVSLYFLTVIGNFCQAMFYYKKVKDMKLTLQEGFSYERLKLKLSKSLVEKLKPPNEEAVNLEELNVTMYFKYEDLTQMFVEEISSDINLSLHFWKIFRNNRLDSNKTIDFNEIFHLTDKIRITKTRIEKLWENLIKIYKGVNELFDIYSGYTEEINDDDLKRKDLEELKRKSENYNEHLAANYYSLLFNKETGIIIANGDKGKEGLIEKTNNEIENIFKFKTEEIKGMNLIQLMPKIFAKIHKGFMKDYFKSGQKKILDQRDFKTFAKDKDNSIISIRIAVKLFPMLNDSVYFVGLITKESLDDIIFIDYKFYIQGMSLKLMKILNIDNKMLFQENKIPFYTICKKFVNFYKIFLQGQKQNLKEKKKKELLIIEESSSIASEDAAKEEDKKVILKKKQIKQEDLHENVEINENMELEYEIRLPQFLIEYSETSNKKVHKENDNQAVKEDDSNNNNKNEEPQDYGSSDNDLDNRDEFGESDLLMNDKSVSNITSNLTSNITNVNPNEASNINKDGTPNTSQLNYTSNLNSNIANNLNSNIVSNITPEGNTPTPNGENNNEKKKKENKEKKNIYDNDNNNVPKGEDTKLDFNKQTDEAKEFNLKIKQYEELFKKSKFDELEELIDNCNNNSESVEYKFNYTFERYKFGDGKISYVVRCIDNKNSRGINSGESLDDNDQRLLQYQQDKIDAFRPYYELDEEEKKDIDEQTDNFLTLLSDYKSFQNLVKQTKDDINKMSGIIGKKKNQKDNEDENASQSSGKGFADDLVKKNRILEIKSNLFVNISNFYTLKYIKLISFCIFLLTIAFVILYLILFNQSHNKFNQINEINIQLFQTTLWTTNLISSLISLRASYKAIMRGYDVNYYCFVNQSADVPFGNIKNYFLQMESYSFEFYKNISLFFGELENKINEFIADKNQIALFWNSETVTYTYEDLIDIENFPLALNQILSDVNSLLRNEYFKIDDAVTIDENNNVNVNLTFYENISAYDRAYLNYISFLSIENAYDNLLPQQYDKVKVIPKHFKEFNSDGKIILLVVLFAYSGVLAIFNIIYGFLLHLTNKNMGDGLEKVMKIKLERIEDIIKRIEGFNIILKKFREKESKQAAQAEEQKKQEGGADTTQAMGTNIITGNINQNSGFSLDAKKFIPLNILNLSYLQTLIIFVVLIACLIPVYLMTDKMVSSTNQIIDVQAFIFGKFLTAGASTVQVKCEMIDCNVTSELNYDNLINKTDMQNIIQGIANFDELDNFYNEKFLLNACQAVFVEGTEEYIECMNNTLIQNSNNTDSLLKLIEETVDIIYEDKNISTDSKNKDYIFNNGTNTTKFENRFLFNTTSFQDLETIFYKYIAPVSNNFAELCKISLKNYLNEKKKIVFSLIIIYVFIITIICLYIFFNFIRRLIHLLSVSRCVIRIIPTTVIINTQELESWIESKY